MRASFGFLFAANVIFAGAAGAQVAGPNINLLYGTQWPDGDPYLQRQNEPSLAVSTRNPQHLLAGSNDYRTVDVPFPNDGGRSTGDAWLSVYRSTDGGLTWRSQLVPGYPQDQSFSGRESALKGYAAGTDPVVRSGTHGLFYYNGLVYNRGAGGATAVFVGTFQDDNNKENGNPFSYLGLRLVATGTSTRSLDKPWIAVDIPRPGTAIGSAVCPYPDRRVTSGNVYVFYTEFISNAGPADAASRILFKRSTDCANSFSAPIVLSEGFSSVQGAVAAIDPATGVIHVAWRQLARGTQRDAIVWTRSIDGGRTFAPAAPIYTFAPGTALDQNAGSLQFRNLTLPTIAVDGSGRAYVAFPARVGPSGDGRVLMSTLAPGASTWGTAYIADSTATGRGHQFFPALSFAYGKLALIFYDLREDLSKSFTAITSDAGLHVRHTVDVRGAIADPAQFNSSSAVPLDFPSVKISQYRMGSRPGSRVIEQLQFNPPNLPMFVKGTRPFLGDYIDVAGLPFVTDGAGNWTYNTKSNNAPVFHAIWTDNRDVRPPPVVCNPTTGVCAQDWTIYTPVGSTGGPSVLDPAQTRPACVPGQTGTRNQNVYSARLTAGLSAGFRENTKTMLDKSGVPIQRGFAYFVQNTRNQAVTYRLTIDTPLPLGTTASFSQNGPVSFLDATVPPRSSISRNVFITSTNPRASVSVTAAEISAPGGNPVSGGLMASAITNPDITNPDITNPDITNPDITNPDITNPDITNPDIRSAEIYNPTITNPDINNPAITNPDITNPQITNPDITNPDITNPDITNPDITNLLVTNPDITNPDITNPDITNPDITNPDITNPDISALPAGGTTDFTWKVTNAGNTGVSYNVRMFQQSTPICCPAGCTGAGCPAGCYQCQLILRRTYPTPIANACTLAVETTNLTVANIPNPVFVTPSNIGSFDNSSAQTNATLALGPGEGGRITLRIFGLGGLTPNSPPPANLVQLTAVAAGANTGLSQNATSLTINTIDLPVGIAGQPYSGALQSVGGVGPTRTWSVSGTVQLPLGLALNAQTGALSGTPSVAGATPVTFQVRDSPQSPVQPHLDKQLIQMQVNQLSVASITALKSGAAAGSPGATYLKSGDRASVTVAVNNNGPAAATNVNVQLTSSLPCTAAAGNSNTIPGNTIQSFVYLCGPVTASGSLTFSAQVGGTYANLTTSTNVIPLPAVTSNSIVVDVTPPTISLTAPANGGRYGFNTSVTAAYSCADTGSGIATCTGNVASGANLQFTQAGPGTFTVTAVDLAGNSASVTYNYEVNYQFSGFLAPLKTAGPATSPTWSTSFTFGKVVAVRFALLDGAGKPIGNVPTAVSRIEALPSNVCGTSIPAATMPATLYVPGGPGLTYNQSDAIYGFNWNTSAGASQGCYNIVVRLNDGKSYGTGVRLFVP